MKLGRKNFLYSALITGFILLFLIIYFIGMLPSLYVDYVEEQYLNAIVEQHQAYLKERSYENVPVRYSTNCMSFEIPKEGNTIYLTGHLFRVSLQVEDARLVEVLKEAREAAKAMSFSAEDKSCGLDEETVKDWGKTIKEVCTAYLERIKEDSPFRIDTQATFFSEVNTTDYSNEQTIFHYISDDISVVELKIQDGDNYYSNYIAITSENGSMILSYLPVMTPRMNELTPIIFRSLPMIIAVTIMIVLVCSLFYSRKIVHPIEDLERYTKSVDTRNAAKTAGATVRTQIELPQSCRNGKDEIAALGASLQELYTRLSLQKEELARKNQELEEENERQEVFLNASSHQLKTPIAAALLLVEGMIQKVGKYADSEKYLPEVKTQLLSMRKLVEDILYISRCEQNLHMQTVPMQPMLEEAVSHYQILIKEKNQKIEMSSQGTMEKPVVEMTDVDLLGKILDNLISNAVQYGEENSIIRIQIKRTDLTEVVIRNRGWIKEDMIETIFDPFVTGNKAGSSHGLGLYIAAYYAKALGASLEIENVREEEDKQEVCVRLAFLKKQE